LKDTDRIVALDILRGLALFGMILVHFHQDMELPATGAEDMVGWGIWMGLETKAWATFALLFGAGFAVLMKRMEARGADVVRCYLRRMLALAVIGAAVQIFLGFAILLEYAFWGTALLFIRKLPTKALLVLAFAAAIAHPLYYRSTPYSRGPYWKELKRAQAEGTYIEAVRARADNMRWEYSQLRTFIPGSSFVLFIIGLLAIRHGIFADPRGKLRTILAAMAFGFVSWTFAWFALLKLDKAPGFGILSDQWLAFTYIGAVLLLVTYRPVWKERLSFFGMTGRMALTNYVIQAAIISWLAFGYGLGLKIRPYYELPAAALMFGLMVVFSRWWLERHRYGPLEKVWRSFTYLSAQPG